MRTFSRSDLIAIASILATIVIGGTAIITPEIRRCLRLEKGDCLGQGAPVPSTITPTATPAVTPTYIPSISPKSEQTIEPTSFPSPKLPIFKSVPLYKTPAESLVGTTWSFEGHLGRTTIQFLENDAVKFSNDLYGVQGRWEPKGRNYVGFNTESFNFMGTLGTNSSVIAVAYSKNQVELRGNEIKYSKMHRIQ